jgi:hypothetical protein
MSTTLPKLIIRPLYRGGRRNPKVQRGALVRVYADGPLGRYVGTTPSGVDWVVYLDKPNAETVYSEQCVTFDARYSKLRGLI